MCDLTDALDLLDGIAFRDRISDEERIPAWRAIKLLYRAGIPPEYCEHLVVGIRRLGSKAAFGPTLSYHLAGVRRMVERMGAQR